MKLFRLLLEHSFRYHSRHRALAALNIISIALGVAIFISIRVINTSALESFKASIDLTAGKANFMVHGDGVRFAESIYSTLRRMPELKVAAPLVEEVALLPEHDGDYLHLLGIDPFTSLRLTPFEFDQGLDRSQGYEFFTKLNGVILDPSLARRLNVKRGDTLQAQMSGRVVELEVIGVLSYSEDAPVANEHMALMDIANAQELLNAVGTLNRIDCLLHEGVSLEEFEQKLRDNLGQDLQSHVRLGATDSRGQDLERMLGAFDLNLTALSLISLMVGLFLVYNSVAAGVVRRRGEIGLLRALGLKRREVRSLFIVEAMVPGLIGVALGVGLGIAGSHFLLEGLAKTISSHYLQMHVEQVFISPFDIALGVTAGVLTVFVAAWFPAREAAMLEPVEAMSVGISMDKMDSRMGFWIILALVCFGVAGFSGWLSFAGGPKWVSFGVAFFVLLGASLLAPPAVVCVSGFLRRSSLGYELQLAVRSMRRSLYRNAITISALVVALAMMVGLAVMIFSFRSTVENWITRRVSADIYVTSATNIVLSMSETLDPEVIKIVKQLEEVEHLNFYRQLSIVAEGEPLVLGATNFDRLHRDHSPKLFEGHIPKGNEGKVLVSESLWRHLGKGAGDTIKVQAPEGEVKFEIAGVYQEYGSDRGLILMDLSLFDRWWKEDRVNSMSLYLKSGADVMTVRDKVRAELKEIGHYLVMANTELREEALNIFDQTFRVTNLLRFIAVTVAGVGIFLSLLILVSERRWEIGLLRAVGATRAQVMRVMVIEAALLGLIGSVIGVLAGIGLAAVLSFVINVVFFGWSIEWFLPWSFLLQVPIWTVIASMLAAIYPAWKAAKIDPAQALRME